jgi:hypothetical protein
MLTDDQSLKTSSVVVGRRGILNRSLRDPHLIVGVVVARVGGWQMVDLVRDTVLSDRRGARIQTRRVTATCHSQEYVAFSIERTLESNDLALVDYIDYG